MSREKNFPQGFKRGDLVCWFDDGATNLTSSFVGQVGIVVPPGSWECRNNRGQAGMLWVIWSDGSKSLHLPGHMEVLAEAETNDL